MTFHEDYARVKANDAIQTGLNSQKADRILTGRLDFEPKSRSMIGWKEVSSTGLVILIAVIAKAVTFSGG